MAQEQSSYGHNVGFARTLGLREALSGPRTQEAGLPEFWHQ